MNGRNSLREELKRKLEEIFGFENEDLDFGIYRILNYKRNEIRKFIEKDLIEEIEKQLNIVSRKEKERVENNV